MPSSLPRRLTSRWLSQAERVSWSCTHQTPWVSLSLNSCDVGVLKRTQTLLFITIHKPGRGSMNNSRFTQNRLRCQDGLTVDKLAGRRQGVKSALSLHATHINTCVSEVLALRGLPVDRSGCSISRPQGQLAGSFSLSVM